MGYVLTNDSPRWPTDLKKCKRRGITGQSIGGYSEPQVTNYAGSDNLSSGMTGLSGKSAQNFVTVKDLDYDVNNFVTIYLRLVCDNNEPRELKSVAVKSNKVPAPI